MQDTGRGVCTEEVLKELAVNCAILAYGKSPSPESCEVKEICPLKTFEVAGTLRPIWARRGFLSESGGFLSQNTLKNEKAEREEAEKAFVIRKQARPTLRDLEPEIQKVRRFQSKTLMLTDDRNEREKIWRMTRNHIVWEEKCFEDRNERLLLCSQKRRTWMPRLLCILKMDNEIRQPHEHWFRTSYNGRECTVRSQAT